MTTASDGNPKPDRDKPSRPGLLEVSIGERRARPGCHAEYCGFVSTFSVDWRAPGAGDYNCDKAKGKRTSTPATLLVWFDHDSREVASLCLSIELAIGLANRLLEVAAAYRENRERLTLPPSQTSTAGDM
jgi:hypothetical protein